MWRVEFDIRAARELKKLAPETRKQILKLTANLSGLWRYRIEDYRVICQIQDDKLVVLALKVGHRREVYR